MSGEGMEITLRDVYERVTDIGAQVAAVAGHMERTDARLEAGQTLMADHEARLRAVEQSPKAEASPGDHEKRLRAVERFQWKTVGGFAAVNAVAVAAEWLLFVRK